MNSPHSLGHFPLTPKWQFDQQVTDCFDDMLARSIPQYAEMRRLVTEVAIAHAKDKTSVVDLGCSRGAQLLPIIDRLGAYNSYLACDVSEPMLDAARETLKPYVTCGLTQIQRVDLRHEFPRVTNVSVFLSVLTLQFTPIEYRARIVEKIYERLNPGGALILVEKVTAATGQSDRLFTDLYLKHKSAMGYSLDVIAAKRESLEGVLVPLSAGGNETLLKDAGFRRVECFWRWCNFAAWVAVR